MEVLVLGAGAVGPSVAARLSAVCTVYAICRKRHADAIAARGFRLTGIWGEGTYHFAAGESLPASLSPAYVIMTSKSVDTHALCEQFSEILCDREVVSLQNGLGNEEILADYSSRVMGGTIITGFEMGDAAEVRVTVEAGPLKLGRFPDGIDASVKRLVELMLQAGIRTEACPFIRSDIWAKTLYNCALNPLGALFEVPYGSLTHPDAWTVIERIIGEAYRVIGEEDVTLPWATAEQYLAYLGSYQIPATAEHHSSMLQDLNRKRRTEIDVLNGAVASRARALGMEAPVNELVTALIKFKEFLKTEAGKL